MNRERPLMSGIWDATLAVYSRYKRLPLWVRSAMSGALLGVALIGVGIVRARRERLRVDLFDQGVPMVLALYIGAFALAGVVYAFVRGPLERKGSLGQYGAIVISGLPAMLVIGRIVAHDRGQEWFSFPTALEWAFAVVGAFLFGAAWYAGTHHNLR